MSSDLPARPSLEHLKKQAKDLVREGAAPRLSDAQRLVAREYGFTSWTKLKQHLETLATNPEEAIVAALRSNDLEMAKRLFAAHAELRAKINGPVSGGAFGATALIAAVQRRNREMIDVLLAAGADINQKSHWWAGGFHVLESAELEMVPFLLERGAVMSIVAAANLGRLDDVERLIRENPDSVRARAGDGQTALHRAATVDIARVLLDHGADIDALDVDHESTPAQYLVSEHPDVARYLVERGARTDILMAAALGDLARVRAFVEADPESVRVNVSPGFFPMGHRHAGGSIYIWTLGVNKTAHIIARERGYDDIFRFLMDRTPGSLAFAVACTLGDRATVDAMLAAHPDLLATLPAPERNRVVVAAARDNNLEAVRLMLAVGWPASAADPNGMTPLHWAAHNGNAEMVRELLRAGARVSARESTYGATALGWAQHGSLHGQRTSPTDYPAVVEALLDAGADISKLKQGEVEASAAVIATLRRRGIGV